MTEQQPMKYLGLVIDIGNDGTIILPDDMMEFAGLKKGGKVEVFSDVHSLYLRTVDEECEFCGQNGKMHKLGNKKICQNCSNELEFIQRKNNQQDNQQNNQMNVQSTYQNFQPQSQPNAITKSEIKTGKLGGM